MTALSVSIIVVSKGRPAALIRCLKGIEQLDYPTYEVVVVADPGGQVALRELEMVDRIKLIPFDTPNISQARNLGLAQAAGEIVAFIDDDAVPEPTWLTYLSEPFLSEDIAAAGGFVRGRNGISFQNKARWVDGMGEHGELDVGEAFKIFAPKDGRAIKTEGTNCAFRREVLAGIGGFDPAFPFYMDETDVNLRLAAGGYRTAIVPLAQVHHGFAASNRRHASRMPRSLFDVGASQMVLLRKHAPQADPEPILRRLRKEQKARLLRHMVAGTCEPSEVFSLMRTLQSGIAAGRVRDIAEAPPFGASQSEFLPFQPSVRFTGSRCLSGRIWQGQRLRRQAAELVAKGQRVSLFLFSLSALYHRVEFTDSGCWEQTGGLWGKSHRDDPVLQVCRFNRRVSREEKRVKLTRNF